MITIADLEGSIKKYWVQYQKDGVWKELLSADNDKIIKVHRFDRVWGDQVKVVMDTAAGQASIAEFGVYDEQR